MPEREVVVTLRLAEGNTRSQFRQINSALIDVRAELTANNKAIRDNAKEQKTLDAALKAGKVTAEQYAVAQRVLVEQRQALKTTNADLKSAEAALSLQYKQLKGEVSGVSAANAELKTKNEEAARATLEQADAARVAKDQTKALANEAKALSAAFANSDSIKQTSERTKELKVTAKALFDSIKAGDRSPETFLKLNSAMIDVRAEMIRNKKAISENDAEQRALTSTIRASGVATQEQASQLQSLVLNRSELKSVNADLVGAETQLSAALRETKNDVFGLTEANLRFRDKMAQATIEALKQQGILGQLAARTETLKNEQNDLDNELKDGKITRDQYNASFAKTNTELAKVEQSEKELRQEVDRLNRELAEGKISVEQYRAGVAGLGKTADQTSGSFAQIFGSFNDGKQAAAGLLASYVGVGAAIYGAVRVIGSSITTIKQFEQEQANLASILGVSRREIEALTNSAIAIGPAFGRAPEEVTRLQVELAKLGFTEPQILAAQEAVILLASATGEDLAKSAEVAAATLKAFDLEATDTQRIVDVMAQSFNATSLDLEKFSVSMATVAPAAKAAGFSVEDTTALIGVLSDRGLDASVAGTSLRSMFIDLSKTGMSLDEALDQIQNSTNKTKTAFELFGERAAGSAVILAENRAETQRVKQALDEAGGAAKKMADEQLKTLDGATKKLSATWDAFILSLEKGDGVIGKAFTGLVGLASKALGLLQDISIAQGGDAKAVARRIVQELDKEVQPIKDKIKELVSAGNEVGLREIQERAKAELTQALTQQGALAQAARVKATIALTEVSKALAQVDSATTASTQAADKNTAALLAEAGAAETVAQKHERLTAELEKAKAAKGALAASDTEGIARAEKQVQSIEAQIAALDGKAKKEKEAVDIVKGSIGDFQKQIQDIEALQARATSSAQFDTYQKQIDNLNASIKALTTTSTTLPGFNPLQQDTVGQFGSQQQGPLTDDDAVRQAELQNAQILAAAQDLNAALLAENRSTAAIYQQQQDELNAQRLLLDAQYYEQGAISFEEYSARKKAIEEETFGLDALNVRNQAEIDGRITLNEQLAILDAEYKAGTIASEEELALKRRQITQAYVSATAQQFSNLFGVLSDLAKEGSAEQKALAIVQALINTYLGVTQALANLPPPASYVAAGVSLASGLAAVAKISGFDQGGMIRDGDGPRYTKNKGDTMLISARAGEVVLNEKQQKRIRQIAGPRVFEQAGVPGFRKSPSGLMRSISNGIPGFVGGGAVTSQRFQKGNGFADLGGSRPSANSLQVAETNAIFAGKEFRAQVSIEEIRDVNNRVEVTEQMASA